MSQLAALAQFAVANNNTRPTKTPVYQLSIEEARERVTIGNGNKKQVEGAPHALTLSLGKIKLGLDIIKAKATRVNVPADQVESTTAVLQDAINDGSFDEAILEAQIKADPANRPPKKEKVVADATDGIDLDALDSPEVSAEDSLADELEDSLG